MSKWLHIAGNVPSLKNGKQIVKAGKFPRLIPSKLHQKYEKANARIYAAHAPVFRAMCADLPKPFYVLLYFTRDSRRRFDFTNATATVQDLIVKAGWVDDDNTHEMIPVYAGHHVNKAAAGVHISVLAEKPTLPIPDIQDDLFIGN